MRNTTKVLLTFTVLSIFYYFGPSLISIDYSQVEIIRRFVSTDEFGQHVIHDYYSPILFISGTSPLEEQNIIADVIEVHPKIKQCKNQTDLLRAMLRNFIKRILLVTGQSSRIQ